MVTLRLIFPVQVLATLVWLCAVILGAAFYANSAYAQSSVGSSPGPGGVSPAGNAPGPAAGPAGGDSGAQSFDGGFTGGATANAGGELNKCVQLPMVRRIRCVAKALERAANRLETRAAYRPAARIIRRAAKRLRATRSIGVALKILTLAKRNILRSYGDRYHVERLTTIMDKAKSVLRY